MGFFKTLFAAFFGFLLGIAVLFLLGLFILAGIASSLDEEPTLVVEPNSVLTLDLSRPIAERGYDDPFLKLMGESSPLGLTEILAAIEAAKTDDNIKGIYLNTAMVGGGMASMESIREALVDFKKSGKFIYSYSELYTEGAYYLASTADSVFLYPEGLMEWNGLTSTPYFLKGMFEKVGVQPMLFKVGTYKSYGETFTNSKMSDAAREQSTVLLGDIWGRMLEHIAVSRKRDATELGKLATDLAVGDAQSALKHKLIDRLAYEDQVINLLKAKAHDKPYVFGDTTSAELKGLKLRKVSAARYAKSVLAMRPIKSDRIAVVYAQGEISTGSGDEQSIGSTTLVETLRRLREDDKIKAVVLRVNSPGGSALASDMIAREMELLKAQKPVIASFGDVAASGGYYIAAGANKIVAQPMTITGSIGIFGLWFNTEKLFVDKLGVTFDRVTTNPYADLGNPNRPMTDVERMFVQNNVNQGYWDFVRIVKNGRQFADSNAVDKIAQGRVWSGIRAKELKLVDEWGGLQTAIELAAKEAKLTEYSTLSYPAVKTTLQKLTEDLSGRIRSMFSAELPAEIVEMRRLMGTYNDPRGLYARMPETYHIH